MVLEEDAHEWFELDEEAHRASPFMLRVVRVRPEQAPRVPAVVHVDGTGRVQTVSRTWAPRLHRLLTAFKARTGIPIVLNTSFNIAGEPIVETPADALWCFLYTGIDRCILGDYVVSKPELVDLALDVPLALTAISIYIDESPPRHPRTRAMDDMSAAGERVISVHGGRMVEMSISALTHPWLRLIVVVPSPFGSIVHGLSGGLAKILRLVDGRRTGREIHAELSSAGSSYPLEQFRRHVGLLRRVGAIGFSSLAAPAVSVA
jgi:carbamoyltransferase